MSQEERRPRRRRWLFTFGVLLGVVVAVVLLLPTLASSMIVPGVIQAAIAGKVNGTVAVSGTSFSWFDAQEIESIKIEGTDGTTSLEVSMTVQSSLFDLLFAWPDIGRVDVELSGKGALNQDGTTSLSSLIREETEGSSTELDTGSSSAPDSIVPAGFGIDAHVHVPSLELAVVGMKRSVTISDLDASAKIQAGGPIELELETRIAADGRSGTLGAKLTLTNGLDADGNLHLVDAALAGSVTARTLRLPTAGEWVEIESLDLAIDSKALGKGSSVTGDASGTFQDSSPLVLQANIDLGALIGPGGELALGPDSISGSMQAQSIPSSLLQPFLVGVPVSLVRDLGPELNLTLDARAGASHTMQMTLDSERVKAEADLTFDTSQISDGTITIAGTLAKSLLAEFGLITDGDLVVQVSGSGLSMALAENGKPELDSFAGKLDVTTEGAFLVDPEHDLRVTDVTATITTAGLAKEVAFVASGLFEGAQLKANGTVTKRNTSGTLSLTQFDSNVLEPLFGDGIPEGVLAGATKGLVDLEVQFKGGEKTYDLTVRIVSPGLEGTAQAGITETLVTVQEALITAKVTRQLCALVAPEFKSTGRLASDAVVTVSVQGLTYDLTAKPESKVQDRLVGTIHAEVDRAFVALVDPDETIMLDALAVDVVFSKKNALQVTASGKASTKEDLLGTAHVQLTQGNVAATLEIADVPAVATLAGVNPAPLQVALGPTATMTLQVPAGQDEDSPTSLTGTITSPRARGDFQAVTEATTLRSAKASFSTKLEPGDLEKALGKKVAIRLVNTVPVSFAFDASQFTLSGEALEDARANMTFAAESMQITGHDESVVNVREIQGKATVRGRDLEADFSATLLDKSDSGGKGKAHLQTKAKLPLGESPFQIGDTVIELVSVPTIVFELIGSDGHIIEAALGKHVNLKATIGSLVDGRNSVQAELSSPYATFSMPQAWLKGPILRIPADHVATGQLQVSPELGQELLSVVHPIFADIASTDHPFQFSVGPLRLPLEGDQASKLNGMAQLDIGEVTLRSTDFGAGILLLLGNAGGTSVPAKFSPLKVTASKGIIEYKDFVAQIGKGKKGKYKQELRFNGKIDLASDPPNVIGISASFPATNLASIFKELRNVPAGLLGTLRPKVTFYGPLYNKKGKRIPLKSKVDPVSFDEGLSSDQVEGIIKGIGDLIRNRN